MESLGLRGGVNRYGLYARQTDSDGARRDRLYDGKSSFATENGCSAIVCVSVGLDL